MASQKEYDDAVANVRSGNASRRDHELVEKQAGTVGSRGNAARAAQKKAGKDKTKSWGNW